MASVFQLFLDLYEVRGSNVFTLKQFHCDVEWESVRFMK